jgi:hypothetical protein
MQLISPYSANYYHHKLKLFKPWYFMLATLLFAGIAVLALRQNNLEMLRLKQQVAVVDEQNGDVEAALKELRQHVYSHMNTNLSSGANAIKPPIQLKYRYERLVAAEQARVSAETSRIYTEAQAVCEAQFPNSFSGGPRVPCIEAYVNSRQVVAKTIPDSLYKFDFVSPAWSPDIAGISMVFSGLSLLALAARLASERWLRSQL